ncbi:MAG: hypothetical protein AAGA54_17195 [Myxococcota bacterium]
MLSQLHEVLVALLREQPEVAAVLIERAFGLRLGGEVRVSAETLREVEPAEYRADAVLELRSAGADRPERAVIVEVQLRADPSKRLTWPAYQAGVRRRLGCPVLLVVVAPTAGVARWCADPIDLDGEGASVVRPFVVGPGNMPVVTDWAEAARMPELAVLSAIAHGHGDAAVDIGRAALAAFVDLDDGRQTLYVDLVFLYSSEVARAALEQEMDLKNYEYKSAFARKYVSQGRAEGRSEGRAQGKAEAILLVLETRGFTVTDEVRAQVDALAPDALDDVLRRAATVGSLDGLFGGRS